MSTRQQKLRDLIARYPHVIEWSKEDDAFVGSAPPLIGHACHGDSAAGVAGQLEAIVADLCEDIIEGKICEPQSLVGKTFSGTFQVRIAPELHRKLAYKSAARKESLNQFIEAALEKA
jgi:predicted HicB family RNase H-like nuclease